jgi:hypothetical protein
MPFFHIVHVESTLGEEEVWSRQARVRVREGHNFWSDRWIAIKILQEFPEDPSHIMDVKSRPLDLDQIFRRFYGRCFPWSRCGIATRWGKGLETWVPVRKGHNFWFDHWISLKFLEEFPDAVFLGVDVESLLREAEVSKPEYRFERAITFDPTVGSRSNF